MQLNLNQIKAITLGAARVTAEENGYNFYRFTKVEEDLYKERENAFYVRTFATSGVNLCFKTDSKNLFIKGETLYFGSRSYYSVDIFVNGEKADSIDNFSNLNLPADYAEGNYPVGEFEKHISLGDGEKEVKIYLPFTLRTVIGELSLDDGATLIPVKPKYKLLAYGDSITQGYDALNPSEKYITKLAEYLNAEEINKAIGGDSFWPELANQKVDFTPDIITVAYGTNDFSYSISKEFEKNAKGFFVNLKANYHNTPIYAITPIWRKDFKIERPFGEFKRVEEIICKTTAEIGGITLISGFNLVEHNENLFGDLRLHPNNAGFKCYFENLIKYFNK